MLICAQPSLCGRLRRCLFFLWSLVILSTLPAIARAADPEPDLATARTAFQSGRYDQSIALAREAIKLGQTAEDWSLVLTDALMIKGRLAEAFTAATNGIAAEPRSIALRWRAREILRLTGQASAAERTAVEIQQLFTERYWAYRNARDLVVFGRIALLAGMEPKQALDKVYEAAKRTDPSSPDPYLASGELALEKHDFALAARFFQEGLKQVPDHPDLQFGLARAYAPSDPRSMLAFATAALEHNSNHLGSLLLLAEHNIDAENYSQAEKLLARVVRVNADHPQAWAFRAVIAHLQNRADDESAARARALKAWPQNPLVEHLIGQKLSQKYRFAEGATCQRRALAWDPRYLPAKSQLAQDLLRLGKEDEGWRLADEVQRADAYDVAANNLVTLRDVLAGFHTLTNEHFVLRMHPREAALYGTRALQLLEQARTRLSTNYGIQFSSPILVEMFPDQKDFAVRTFGMPENNPFLGVCFGMVITANSPAANPGSPFNWESMLWHEFCHSVTLHLTRNKMPRWISEGISVYEERQANPAWGERMNPRYREMILGDDLTPVSELSGAFLAPKSPLHMQFAYYQSSLVVEFLIGRFGREKLLGILRDLGQGIEPNQAIATNTLPLPQLEKDFAAYARDLANNLAPGVDLETPAPTQFAGTNRFGTRAISNPHPSALSGPLWDAWAKSRPTNYWVMLRKAERLADERNWVEARPLLEQIVRLYPNATGPESPYRSLALGCRELGDTNAEREVLSRLAAIDDEATEAYLRLMELASDTADWPVVLTNAARYLAVDPLVPSPYRYFAKSSEALGDAPAAIQAYQALLQLDDPNPADIHFRLAALLHRQRDPLARRHLLQALEEAPRFRHALLLLRQMRDESHTSSFQ